MTLIPGYDSGPACPKCNAHSPKPVSFTWWGGVIGPKLFHHVKCQQCGQGYNGKTGKLNTAAIAIYCVVCAIIFVIIAVIVTHVAI